MKINPKEKEFYRDETGMRIEVGDLLEVYHFVGARKKKYFMYHIAILQESHGTLWWAGKAYHLDGNKGHYWLKAVNDKDNGIIPGTTIISKADFENEAEFRKEARKFWASKKP